MMMTAYETPRKHITSPEAAPNTSSSSRAMMRSASHEGIRQLTIESSITASNMISETWQKELTKGRFIKPILRNNAEHRSSIATISEKKADEDFLFSGTKGVVALRPNSSETNRQPRRPARHGWQHYEKRQAAKSWRRFCSEFVATPTALLELPSALMRLNNVTD
eukprot:Selendium_serpulae@DN5342_c0_g1_i3.p1